jgi:hypothetical protein
MKGPALVFRVIAYDDTEGVNYYAGTYATRALAEDVMGQLQRVSSRRWKATQEAGETLPGASPYEWRVEAEDVVEARPKSRRVLALLDEHGYIR